MSGRPVPRTVCPVCGGAKLADCLDRASVPVFQNALYASAAAARAAVTGRLAIRFCRACGFGFNAAFDADLVAYGADYENDQTLSGMFSAHVDRMAENVLAAASGISRPTILEVGCGQGYFLERLVNLARAPLGAALGFDPSFRGVAPAPLQIQARVFDRAAAEEIRAPIDIVVSRHVIEHIVEPVAFLESLRAALPGGNAVELFLETPCVDWILAGRVVQDFFYEHCSYFTAGSLAFCLERAGFAVEAVEHVFEGQYLWARARPAPLSAATPRAGSGQRAPSLALLALAERFAGGSGGAEGREQGRALGSRGQGRHLRLARRSRRHADRLPDRREPEEAGTFHAGDGASHRVRRGGGAPWRAHRGNHEPELCRGNRRVCARQRAAVRASGRLAHAVSP
jgi:SAM-dependent methyltransferase